MKKVLIISPYFVPSNAADMHRARMSLPYFIDFGWEAEVVTVDLDHSEMVKDYLFEKGLPDNLKIHYVSAFDKKITSKAGLGSLALRSLWFYKKKVDWLLSRQNYDLIYFSTTQFPITILGRYWKNKFNIPYVIDMQDPWHSEYYLDKPRSQRPKKFWFSYRLNKTLEPLAMKTVDGIVSVSESYIKTLEQRYPQLSSVPKKVITFGYLKKDFEIAKEHFGSIESVIRKDPDFVYLVYIGRGGFDMQPAIEKVLLAFKELLDNEYEAFKYLRFRFIGTSYAPNGSGAATFSPIASSLNVGEYVEENTNRVTFFENIKGLLCADGLLIPGSDDPGYTASKIYPCILAKKPLLALFNPESSAYKIIKGCNAGTAISLSDPDALSSIKTFLSEFVKEPFESPATDWERFEQYSARNMTDEQCKLFDSVIERFKSRGR